MVAFLAPLVAQAIVQGIRIVGLRIIPYLVREGTKLAAKQTAKQAVKKVGTQKITETGYIVVTNNPTKFKLAQKIFGKNKVFKSDVLSAQSTSSRSYEAITAKTFKKLTPEIKRTVASQADDAANGVSRFILNPKSNPAVGGTKVMEPFNKFFEQNIKFTDKTLKNIKLAELGPTALGREVAIKSTAFKAGTTISKPVLAAKEATKKTIKEFKEKLAVPKIPVRTGKELATQITTVEKAPWYVAIMPKFLRTTKEVLKRPDAKEALMGKATERIVTPAVHWGRVGTGAAIGTAIPAVIGGMTPEEKEAESTARDLDYNQLFGTTGTEVPEDLDIPSAIQTFSD